MDNQNPHVITVCLRILGLDAIEFVKKELRRDEWMNLDARLKMSILNVPIVDKRRERRALEILSKWKSYYRPLVAVALIVFNENSQRVSNVCAEILQNWDKDYQYYKEKEVPKYSGHIRKAMSHPELLQLSKLTAIEIIKKEEEKPGYIDDELLEFAQFVVEGTIFDWTDPI